MADKQKTIGKSITLNGTGLHTGQPGQMTFHSAPVNHGIKFRRIDLKTKPIIAADVKYVVSTARGTTIAKNGASIYTVEHVLAAFTGMGIDNILVDLDMEEIPIKDGSSKFFTEAIKEAGIIQQNANRKYIIIKEPISFEIPEKKVKMLIEPADFFFGFG